MTDTNEQRPAPASDGQVTQVERRFWLLAHEPGLVPVRKGPWPLTNLRSILREFIAAKPVAYLHVLTEADDGPQVDHGPEVLQMLDGRSMSVGRKHNARTLAAHRHLGIEEGKRLGAGVDATGLAELIGILQAVTVGEDGSTFEHSPEEIGVVVMENHKAVLAALTAPPQAGGWIADEAMVERVAAAIWESGPDGDVTWFIWVEYCDEHPSLTGTLDEVRRQARAALAALPPPPAAQPDEDHIPDAGKMVEALTPSGDTKAAYHGEFSFSEFQGVDDDGSDVHQKVYVPWTTIKEIMAAILARAKAPPPIRMADRWDRTKRAGMPIW